MWFGAGALEHHRFTLLARQFRVHIYGKKSKGSFTIIDIYESVHSVR